MLSVTPILLLIAGGVSALLGFVTYFSRHGISGTSLAVNLWFLAAIFLSVAAITHTLNWLTRTPAGDSERRQRAEMGTNVLVGGIAVASVLVTVVFGLVLAETIVDG